MQSKFYLTLVLITLLTFIIIPGCGGNNNSINPISSINTPTPAIYTPEGNVGYLTINIVWPQAGKKGKCSILSENDEKDLTASMPVDTTLIKIKVRDPNETNPDNTIDPNGTCTIIRDGRSTITEELGPLPVIKVIVRAEAYDSSSAATPISINEQELKIKPGNASDNTVNLDLGEYKLTLNSDPDIIYPDFISGGDSTITATLKIEYTPDPNDPNSTPTPRPIPNKTIDFSVLSGKGFFSETNDITANGTTDPNGECKVTLTWDKTDEELNDIQIQAEFKPDPNSSPSTKTCNVSLPCSLVWKDDFEGYTPSSWPVPLWISDGNASSDRSTNRIEIFPYEGSQSLRLHGRVTSMWGALAHHFMMANPSSYEIRLKMYNNNDSPLQGHHFRGRVAISSGPSWSNSTTTLLKCYESGALGGYGISGSYSILNWYSIRIQYLKSSAGTAKINYLVKQEPDGTPIETSSPISVINYPYLTLESGGGTTYFDDIQIYDLSANPNNKINSSEWIEENIPPGEIVQELYDPDK
jgi:hypothetical protein